jgi:hypothetical protein
MLGEISNPWHRLPSHADYVLPEDAAQTFAFNLQARPEVYLHLNLIPEPFLGLPDAPVVVLNRNPGYSEGDDAHHVDPLFVEYSRANLLHRATPFPFFLLDPAVAAPGNRYWSQKLKALIGECSLPTVAQKVLCVEYFPYHSIQFGFRRKLPSQDYSFSLVREAVGRKSVIVLMRGRKEWISAVPMLSDYPKKYELNSSLNVAITAKNCPKGFTEICAALRR